MKIWKAIPILLLAACTGRDIHIDRITLDQPSLMLLSGESATVNVRFLSGKSEGVDWFSDDTAVATVNAGTVTAVAKGKTLVFAKTQKSGLLACCEVTVRNVPDVVSGIEISQSQLTLEEGSSEQLLATVLPETAENKAVTWKSSADTVVTVGSGGVVYAVAIGEAIITATTKEGGFSASCFVSVVPIHYALEDVSIPESISLKVGQTMTLTPEFTPENASNKEVTWFSYNDSVATVDASGMVTGVAVGSTYIKVTAAEGDIKDICYVTVTE